MIQEDYCSFEVARLLKDKGFGIEEETRGYYPIKGDAGGRLMFGAEYHHNTSQVQISAPTHQMAMKWLRERQIDIVVFHERLPEDCYWARIEKYPYTEHQQEPIYQTYEEAVDAALKYALENLV